MNRITIGLYDETYQKLEKNAKAKNLSLSNYVRNVIELGLRVEENLAKNEEDSDKNLGEIDALGELKILWKNSLSWLLETRHLVRYLVRNTPGKDQNILERDMEHVKDKSEFYVNGLLKEKVKDD